MWALILVLAACLLTDTTAYYFESGYSYHYTYTTENAAFGQRKITTIIKFHITFVNETDSQHRLHSLAVDSFVQFVQGGIVMDNPKKWNLSNSFLFATDDNGSVALVHCHPEDNEELLFIKKAIVSVFSINLKVHGENEEWNYRVQETDSLGSLQQNYTVQRTDLGLKLERRHASLDKVHRFHDKTLHYDHARVLHSAESKDRILLRNKEKPGKIVDSLPKADGKTHVRNFTKHLPDIDVFATSSVKLNNRRKMETENSIFRNLTIQTLEIKKPAKKYPLPVLMRNISDCFECLRLHPTRDNLNSSKCVENLRVTLKKLHNGDYRHLMNMTLSQYCNSNDTVCQDRRLTLLDVIGSIGDDESQSLLLTHVLLHRPPVEKEIKNVLIHCISIEHPLPKFVHAVEEICFGKDGESHGTLMLSSLQRHACLAVGSLTRNLAKIGQEQEANRLADRLETWLQKHGEGDNVLNKRDVSMSDTVRDEYHISKAILLHAIGNAALPRSRRHLLLHAQSNRGHHMWRRAALDALRHYTCSESARVLYDTLWNDERRTVRRKAFSIFSKHPRRHEVTTEQENNILSQNYTYPSVVRVKRDLTENITGKTLMNSSLGQVPINKKQHEGSDDIGGTHSLELQNGINVVTSILDSYIDLDFSDKISLEADIGMVNTKKDLSEFDMCYSGRMSYNMNMFKDFDLDFTRNIHTIFGQIVSKLVEPLVATISSLTSHYHDANSNLPISGFQLLTQSVKALPTVSDMAVQSIVAFRKAVDAFGGVPLASKIQHIATKAQSLMEDIRSEATELYTNLADAAIIVLPYSERELRSSLNTILNHILSVGEYPKQTLAIIEKALMGFQLAMNRIVEANSRIRQATAYLSASRHTFLNAADEVNATLETIDSFVERLKTQETEHTKTCSLQFTDFAQLEGCTLRKLFTDIFTSKDALKEQLLNFTENSYIMLQKGLDRHQTYVYLLLQHFEDLILSFNTIKSRVNAQLGKKFHPLFPAKRRGCDNICGCGYYPTRSDRYNHPGVDIELEPQDSIACPVTGMIFALGESLIIRPMDSDFIEYELILTNIQMLLNFSNSGTFVVAGQVIGTSKGRNNCDKSHFNIAMRWRTPDKIANETAQENTDGTEYYVDPTPFLKSLIPQFQWHDECKESTMKLKGQVVGIHPLPNEFHYVSEVVQQNTVALNGIFLPLFVADLPESPPVGPSVKTIVHSFEEDPSNLKNLYYGGEYASIKFFDDVSFNNYDMETLIKIAENDSDTKTIDNQLINIKEEVENMLRNSSLHDLTFFPTACISRILTSRGITNSLYRNYDRMGMLIAAQTINERLCPAFNNRASGETDSICIPHNDCLGVDCDVMFSHLHQRETVAISVKINSGGKEINIATGGKEFDVQLTGQVFIKLETTVFDIYGTKIKITPNWSGSELGITLSITACSVDSCLQEILLLKNTIFKNYVLQKRDLYTTGLFGEFRVISRYPILTTFKILKDFIPPFPMQNSIPGDIYNYYGGVKYPIPTVQPPSIGYSIGDFSISSDFMTSAITIDLLNIYEPVFYFFYIVFIGGIPVEFEIEAGGAMGTTLSFVCQAIDVNIKFVLGTWDAFYLKASFSINVIVVEIGFSLTGYFLKDERQTAIGFQTNSVNPPFGVRNTVEENVYPLEVEFSVFMRLIFFIRFEVVVLRFQLGYHQGTALSVKVSQPDTRLPRISLTTPPLPVTNAFTFTGVKNAENIFLKSMAFARRKRSEGSGCSITQAIGRHPKDPAYQLEFSVEDDDSSFQLFYAIGTYPGGKNVKEWTKMHGTSLLVPESLPCGVALYFLVMAQNEEGRGTTAQCSIPTYDCTLPNGRVIAEYRCSSHSRKLAATVIVHEDSPLNKENLFYSVGYSPSFNGHEVVDWGHLNLSQSHLQNNIITGDLKYFSIPMPGRLATAPITTIKSIPLSECASECLKRSTCISFSYNQFVQECELQDVAESTEVERNDNDYYQTYERLDTSFSARLTYESQSLRHGTKYFFNVAVENVLGYNSLLTSQGTMVDFTPPEPGPLGDVIQDILIADNCEASTIQRCVENIAFTKNHRKIIDGKESRTVFNGNRKGQETLFTIENYQIAANWDGFKDEECGIYGYTWAVGTTLCGTEVVGFTNPHASIRNRNDWTNMGLATNLQLTDGAYYITVQAVSDIIYGGDLVTTVCHSIPVILDTSLPNFNGVKEVLFDETFRHLVIYYSATDDISGIERVEVGLGRTKYDVMIRQYMPFEIRGQGDNTYLVNEDFQTAFGDPAWIRLKVVNNVGLSATGSSDAPILLDSTEPIRGLVLDGTVIGQDICCQMDISRLCAQWPGFFDPESNIESYEWGIGLSPGRDDVLAFQKLSSFTKQSCSDLNLQHNTTYYTTIVAYNKALNQKSVNFTSDGVLIDSTPPLPGIVVDGTDVTNDVNYTSETASVKAAWADFTDSESGMESFSVAVFVNNKLQKETPGINADVFTDHSFSFQHGDVVHVEVQATNNAGGNVIVSSDGMLVDHTPPQLMYLGTTNEMLYQLQDDVLDFIWEFQDQESGLLEYRCSIRELYNGLWTTFWPEHNDFHSIPLNESSPRSGQLHLEGLNLHSGAEYTLKVTALNRAKMATSGESVGVTVDTSPPVILKLSLASPGEEEELNEEGKVEIVDGEPLSITWFPQDSESGILESVICIDWLDSENCSTSTSGVRHLDGSLSFTTSFTDLNLTLYSDDVTGVYQAFIVVRNGAGINSSMVASKPFVVLKANVAGTVIDGRKKDDIDFSDDHFSIAMSFLGFSSEACGIESYDWGVGTKPFITDIIPFSDYGLVVDNEGFGFAQAHIMLFEGQTYYSTVRAKTGYDCHEEYIVSSSNGFTLDMTPPRLEFRTNLLNSPSLDVVYQTQANGLTLDWVIQDSSGVNETRITTNVFSSNVKTIDVPTDTTDILSFNSQTLSGDSVFSIITMKDNAGNAITSILPLVTFDFTSPIMRNLKCTERVSVALSLVKCAWLTIEEPESPLVKIEIGIGNGPSIPNLVNMTSLPLHSTSWAFYAEEIVSESDIAEFYIIMRVINAAGNWSEIPLKVINDISPPDVSTVEIVTSPSSGIHSAMQICQSPQDYVEVIVHGIHEEESEIRSVGIALGSSKGRTDIKNFHEWQFIDSVYVMGNLALTTGSVIYATVKVTNDVGLYTVAYSNGVIISPEPHLEVIDGPDDTDSDAQAHVYLMQGMWKYSDPCPILSAHWSIQEISGETVTNYTEIPKAGNHFYNDMLHLQNFKTYVNFVKIVDALYRTYTAYSDGITVTIQRPNTAAIRDGLGGSDLSFQEATDRLSAEWDSFGNVHSNLLSDRILRYEVAVGTDRKYASTRSNIHAFEDVGLEKSITFYGLNLTAKSVTYYITVRAHSAAGSYVESSSDGIKVGYSADIKPGQVSVDSFQSSLTSMRFSWTESESDMAIIKYYAGISTELPLFKNSTYACIDVLTLPSLFDVHPLQEVADDYVTVVDGLTLTHNGTYYVTVMAESQMGQCSIAISNAVRIDVTPPVIRKLHTDGVDAGPIIILHSMQSIVVYLEDAFDVESSIAKAVVTILLTHTCNVSEVSDNSSVISSVTTLNESLVTIRNLDLQEGKWYFMRVTVTNGAGLETKVISKPIIIDISPPQPGVVKVSFNWTSVENAFQNHNDSVQGIIALENDGKRECIDSINLLSSEIKPAWEMNLELYSMDCAGFDKEGLYIIVQHDPFLKGVDKGAAQYKNLTMREGNFTFRLLPGNGKSVLTGIALNSPYLSPPFLLQNGVTVDDRVLQPCDPSSDACPANGNETNSESPMRPDTDYGVGISFLEDDNIIKALVWFQDQYTLKQTWIPLDFDPTSAVATYSLNFKRQYESTRFTWEVAVFVDGKSKATVSGLNFLDDISLSVYSWNVNDFSPPVTDVFTPFRVITKMYEVTIPVTERPLCSYGTPFKDTLSGVKEVWVGVSDSSNETANVMPFQLMYSFCLQCPFGCDSMCSSCSETALTDDFAVLPVTLTGLNLYSASDFWTPNNETAPDFTNSTLNLTASEFDSLTLPSYYIDVRVVDQGGLATESKSGSILVDTSSPVIKFIHVFDPEYSIDETVTFVGNNHTVGVRWDATDDISKVTEVWVSLGTKPDLDDMYTRVFVVDDTQDHVFQNGATPFQDGQTYFVTVEAKNAAGLGSKMWGNFTVLTTPPNISSLILTPSNTTVETLSGVKIAILEKTEHLELRIDVTSSVAQAADIEYYEWAIGSDQKKEDLFPRSRVGLKGIKYVSIVDGYMKLDGLSEDISIRDYTNRNSSSDALPGSAGNTFMVEPGRCLRQQLYALSSSHVASAVDVIPTCIKRKQDILVRADNTTQTFWTIGSNLTNVASLRPTNSLQIKIKPTRGALMVGVLNDSDLNAEYGSSASADFAPFIVQPDSMIDFTSRWLKNRVISMPGPHIFISPVGEAQLEDDVEMSYVVPSSVDVYNDSSVTVIFWNADIMQWQSPDEMCPFSNEVYEKITRTVSMKLCPGVFSTSSNDIAYEDEVTTPMNTQSSRIKRSTGQAPPVLNPRMFTVSVIRNSSTNTSPKIQNMSVVLMEDTTIEFDVAYTDNEGDEVTFWLPSQPKHGKALVSTDGHVRYKPNIDFSGIDVIHVKGEEQLDPTLIAKGLRPNRISNSISVNVTEVNDPPSIVYRPHENDNFVTQNYVVGSLAGNGINVSVLIQSNTTTLVQLGHILYCDVDPADNVSFINRIRGNQGAEFEVHDITRTDFSISGANLACASGTGGKNIGLILARNFSGNVKFDARVNDTSGTYSMQVSLDVYVLLNPCTHGHCEPRMPSSTCHDPQRAVTFDPFLCRCDVGYEGQWCQTDTDECRSAACSPITDCVNLIGDYRCDVNPSKLAAIIVCSVVATVLVTFVVCKLKKKKTKVADCWNENLTQENMTAIKMWDYKDDVGPDSLESCANEKMENIERMQANNVVATSTLKRNETATEFDHSKISFFMIRPDKRHFITQAKYEEKRSPADTPRKEGNSVNLKNTSAECKQHLASDPGHESLVHTTSNHNGGLIQDARCLGTSASLSQGSQPPVFPSLSRPVSTGFAEENQLPRVVN